MAFVNDKPVSVLSPEERSKYISGQIKSALGSHFVLFRGQYIELPVIPLPIDYLIYRADNGRLIMQLQELQRNQELPADYFRTHQETEDVQARLHTLLLELSRDPSGPIYQELKRQAMQTEPILITADGVVVNGNRRLAAMRELLALDESRYAPFQEVRAAVLPPEAGPDDIEYIEAALQLAPETKLAYSWINRRLKLRRQRFELGLPLAQILESYRLESEDQLDRELAELALAEDYLENILGQPGHYALIEDAEKLFVGLWTNLSQLPENDSHLWRLAGLAMISARREMDTDLSAYFPFAPPKPAFIPFRALERLSLEYELLSEKQLEENPQLPEQVRRELATVFSRTEDAAVLTSKILDILDQLQIEHREQSAPKRLLKHMRQARQLLEELRTEDRGLRTEDRGSELESRIPRLSQKQKAQMQSELAAILAHSRQLLGAGEAMPLVGGYAERSKGLDPDRPSFKAGLAHALRAVIGRRLSRALGHLLRDRGPRAED